MTQPTDALLAGLAAHSTQLEQTARELRETYRFSRWLKATITIGALLGAGLVGIALLNLSNGAAIRSCTTPQGDCYQRGQQTTGKAVAEIVAEVNAHTDLVFLATLECAHPHRAQVAFERCMARHGLAQP